MSDYKDICTHATEWVRDAGKVAMEHFGHVTVTRKADKSPVTEADHAVQAALQQAISDHCPEDAVITEETQADPEIHASVASARRCWVIDPIDGTRNYARSIPIFTISVALLVEGSPCVGLIYDPVTDRLYHATRGGGAWCGTQRIAAESPQRSSTLTLTIPTSLYEKLGRVEHGWIDHMVVRNFGSTALHMALAASGAIDAVFCKRCRLWDMAAGDLIVTEADRVVIPLDLDRDSYFPMNLADYNNEPTPLIAAHPEVAHRLLSEYRETQKA